MNRRLDTLQVTTPEGVVFSQWLAGPITRFLAWGVDLACIGLLSTVMGWIVHLFGVIAPDTATAIALLIYFLITIGYAMVLEWFWRGQTLGKWLLRLRVMDAEGLKLQFHQVAIRNLLRFVDSLPLFYLVGGAACLATRRAQRLGDLAANTVVVRMPKWEEPDLEQWDAGKYNSLRAYPYLAARLRRRVEPGEAAVALEALLRRDQFDPPDRVALFEALAGHFKEKVSFPQEATDGIAHEQYVRNVVDILYQKH